ncbi:MAG: dihydrolipoamide acetyltransferase family protein [Bacteroidales bacterium]
MKKEIKIPDIAENVDTGLIAGILVSKGDEISADQAVVEVETDKATTDIPSPYAGTVDEIKVEEGDEVKVGQVIMIIEAEEEESGSESEKATKDEEQKEDSTKEKESKETEDEKDKEEKKRPDKEKKKDEEEEKKAEVKEGEKDEKSEGKEEKTKASGIPAAPSVRRLARELDVDLENVEGSGPGNRISAKDVKKYADKGDEETMKAELPDFSQWGSITSESMTNIRKITADNVGQAWRNIPHVTQFDEADMTGLENFRKENQEKVQKEGGKLTVTALLLKISAFALQKFSRFNASIDMQNKKIIYKHYYNIGVAVDTTKGLLVPVVRKVNEKSLSELSSELSDLAEKARKGKISPDEMQGGNFTISNLGGIGGTAFTPIVYSPQAAILGVSRAKYQQVFRDDEFQKRLVIPLSLSYDHRIIDGADGARFLRWICEVIEDPYAILF